MNEKRKKRRRRDMDSREGEGGRGLRIFEELEAGMRTKGKGLANELKDPTLVA